MSRNGFAQCERDYNEREDAIAMAKAQREENHLKSDAFLHELWALAQGDPARDAIAAMREFIEKNLR
jgi:hypothetical protein